MTLASDDLQRLKHDGAMKLLAKALELTNDSPRIASQMLMSHGYAPNIDETSCSYAGASRVGPADGK